MGGAEALAMLRRDPLTAHIPVIALTANAMPRDVESGLAAGFFRYLTKPLDVMALLAALDAALARPPGGG
jgi:CheY-like chemotaxis protein